MKMDQSSEGRVVQFDHTGDLGIEVTAPTLARLLELSAEGMFSLLTDVDTVGDRTGVDIEVSAPDLESLMVRWLSELNFIHLTEGLVFRTFEIISVDETSLRALVRGEPLERGRHLIHTEIKAVTFHHLTVEKRNDLWHARIIFDI